MRGILPRAFFGFSPHLPFRFAVQFVTGDAKLQAFVSDLQFAVQSCNITQMSADTSTAAVHGGDGYFTIPLFDTTSRTLELTMEETDDMRVLRLADKIIEQQRFGLPNVIGVVVHQFAANMNTLVSSRLYSCVLQDYDEPTFARTGGPNLVTEKLKFIIMSESDWNENSTYKFGKQVATSADVLSELEKEIAATKASEELEKQAKEFMEEEKKRQAAGGTAPADNTSTAVSGGTRDFNASEEEILANYNKIKAEDKNGSKVTYEAVKEVSEKNAAAMNVAVNKLQDELAKSGLAISVNAYNDSGHATGIGSKGGSHLLGQKVDLTIRDKNGKKITAENMTAEQKALVQKAAAAAGLVTNYERHDDANSLWGDFALAKAATINKNGEVVEQTFTSWTKGKVYNVEKKQKENLA